MMKRFSFLFLILLISCLGLSCPETADDPVFGARFLNNSDSTWQVYWELSSGYRENPSLIVQDNLYDIKEYKNRYDSIIIEQSSPVRIGVRSTEKHFLDYIHVPISPIFRNLTINNTDLIKGDTVDISFEDSLYFTWDSIIERDSSEVTVDDWGKLPTCNTCIVIQLNHVSGRRNIIYLYETNEPEIFSPSSFTIPNDVFSPGVSQLDCYIFISTRITGIDRGETNFARELNEIFYVRIPEQQ